jgi:2-polyprenyl-3-methyl-5-hydroxy-6-metoxy-1,4-benzoquinol methylase
MTQKTEKKAWECYTEGTDYQFSCSEIALGPWTSYSLMNDPKHMAFVLARYKFCAKMLEGRDFVVEIGCGDGFGIPLMAQAVGHLHCIDWDPRNLEGCKKRLSHLKNVSYEHVDLNTSTLKVQADAAFSIDVIEHLEPELEARFMENTLKFLKPSSVLITGTPNITASAYASERSAVQHINLKSMHSLRDLTKRYFKHVFMFGMNDEIVHTGYHAMSHYIWSLGAEKK